jgi:hypothetical protein
MPRLQIMQVIGKIHGSGSVITIQGLPSRVLSEGDKQARTEIKITSLRDKSIIKIIENF